VRGGNSASSRGIGKSGSRIIKEAGNKTVKALASKNHSNYVFLKRPKTIAS
jgi:hypothetical protein